jgi:DNA-binding PadR family transcriptional regulator
VNVEKSSVSRVDRAPGLMQVAILNVIDRYPARAYGSAITDEVSRLIGKEIADAQVYVALRRLEEHGLISSHVDIIPSPSKKSRGHPRKYYALAATGRRAMESAGAYFSAGPFMQPASRGGNEGTRKKGQAPSAVVV